MPSYSNSSKAKLNTCHDYIYTVFMEAIKIYDCTILEGERGKTLQDLYFEQGKSEKQYPDGKHNNNPSEAVDAVPYPIDWKDLDGMRHFAGVVIGIGYMISRIYDQFKDCRIRWGGDWNQNRNLSDQNFFDLPHFEMYEVKE